MDFHEAACIFPLDEENLNALADDIKTNGLQVPIEVFAGKIIDGRRRFLACSKVGIVPEFRTVEVNDPIAYVVSLNLHRRQLTTSQRAMVAARAREIYDRQAKERQQAAGGDRRSERTLVSNLPQPKIDTGKSRDKAGEAFNVGGSSVEFATKVLRDGAPELVKAVDEGRLAVSTAAAIATKPKEEQPKEIDNPKPREEYKKTSREKKTANAKEKALLDAVTEIESIVSKPSNQINFIALRESVRTLRSATNRILGVAND